VALLAFVDAGSAELVELDSALFVDEVSHFELPLFAHARHWTHPLSLL
jgi:hypothetical protein